MLGRKSVRFKGLVKSLEVVNVKEGDTLRPDDVLVLKEGLVVWQGKHELGQAYVVPFVH